MMKMKIVIEEGQWSGKENEEKVLATLINLVQKMSYFLEILENKKHLLTINLKGK